MIFKNAGGREEYIDWFDNDNPYDKILHKLYRTSDDFLPTEHNLDEVSLGKRVILTNRVYILSKSIHDVFPMPINVFTNQIEMISERGFPLLKPYSDLIADMRDSGVIQKLYNDFHYNATTLHHIRDKDGREEDGLTVLTLGHLDGAFTVLILGLLVSAVTFVVEIIVGTYKKRHRTRKMWKLLRRSLRQVSMMRSVKKNRPRNVTDIKNNWNAPKRIRRRVRFNTSNDAFKSSKRNVFQMSSMHSKLDILGPY